MENCESLIDCDPLEPVSSERTFLAMFTFFEFFAGGGMARAGLGNEWRCLFANDFDEMKANAYRENWPGDELHVGDIAKVTPKMLPGPVDLAWASFPCQDLSLAGDYRGLGSEGANRVSRSGTFWPFWQLIRGLRPSRVPTLIVLENVYGTLRSNRGRDFAAIINALASTNYRVGAVVVDAKWFVPQSRPRLFIIGVNKRVRVPTHLIASIPKGIWHPPALVDAVSGASAESKDWWMWWNLPEPKGRRVNLDQIIEETPPDLRWHSVSETTRLLSLMSDTNRRKVEDAMSRKTRQVGTIYRRTRSDEFGNKVQRAEIRFDGIAGCLRTPVGGSSRQTILVVEGKKTRSRLLSSREAARLMGLPDSYRLPQRYNDAYHLVGDGVAVPVVGFLNENLFEPILSANAIFKEAAE